MFAVKIRPWLPSGAITGKFSSHRYRYFCNLVDMCTNILVGADHCQGSCLPVPWSFDVGGPRGDGKLAARAAICD
jgi:hypothetical protein